MTGRLLAGLAAIVAWMVAFAVMGASLGGLAILTGTRHFQGHWFLAVLLVVGGGCALVAVWAHGRVVKRFEAELQRGTS